MSRSNAVLKLSEETTYAAMKAFIEAYWERGGRSSHDFAVLLGNFEIDPAMRSDWAEAVQQVLANGG